MRSGALKPVISLKPFQSPLAKRCQLCIWSFGVRVGRERGITGIQPSITHKMTPPESWGGRPRGLKETLATGKGAKLPEGGDIQTGPGLARLGAGKGVPVGGNSVRESSAAGGDLRLRGQCERWGVQWGHLKDLESW